MLGALVFSIYSSIYGFLGSLKGKRIFLVLAWGGAFVFLALRHNYGNDFPVYKAFFERITQTNWAELFTSGFTYERGYILINKIFSYLGFNVMLAIFALLNISAYYKFAAMTVGYKYMFLVIFLFMFDPYIMLVQANTLRQTISIGIFFCSLPALKERRILLYLFMITLAIQFHLSAIILLPLYLFLQPKPIAKLEGWLVLALYVFLVAFFGKYLDGILKPIFSLMPKYAFYKGGSVGAISSGLGLVFNMLVIGFMGYSAQSIEGYRAIAIRGVWFYYLFSAVSINLGMLSRLSMYFEPFLMFAIPICISKLKSNWTKMTVVLVFCAYFVRNFFFFFQDPTWIKAFSTYTTILGV